MKDCTQSMRSVSDLSPGEQGTVSAVLGRGAIRRRLLDIGILPSVDIEVERLAPSGDPIWIKARGMHVSLRRSEAQRVLVQVC